MIGHSQCFIYHFKNINCFLFYQKCLKIILSAKDSIYSSSIIIVELFIFSSGFNAYNITLDTLSNEVNSFYRQFGIHVRRTLFKLFCSRTIKIGRRKVYSHWWKMLLWLKGKKVFLNNVFETKTQSDTNEFKRSHIVIRLFLTIYRKTLG